MLAHFRVILDLGFFAELASAQFVFFKNHSTLLYSIWYLYMLFDRHFWVWKTSLRNWNWTIIKNTFREFIQECGHTDTLTYKCLMVQRMIYLFPTTPRCIWSGPRSCQNNWRAGHKKVACPGQFWTPRWGRASQRKITSDFGINKREFFQKVEMQSLTHGSRNILLL